MNHAVPSNSKPQQPQGQHKVVPSGPRHNTNWLLLCCRRWYLLVLNSLKTISTSSQTVWSGRLVDKSSNRITDTVGLIVGDPIVAPISPSNQTLTIIDAAIMSAQQNNNNNDSSFSSSNTEDYNDADERRRRIYKNRSR